MKVLQLIPALSVGGTERGTVELAQGLVQRGHEALVISGGGELVKLLESCGAKHIPLPVGSKSPWTILRMIRKVSEIIIEEKVDLVHARSRIPGLIGFFASRRAQVPFVTTCHGYYRRNIFGTVMGWGKRVIVSSHAIGRHMLEDFETSEERLRVIARGVDPEVFRYRSVRRRTSQEKTIAMIGRITPLKGHADFIRAVSRVVRVFPTLRVLIVGEAPSGRQKYHQDLQLLVRRLGLHRSVEFRETTHDVPGLLGELDLLVLASRTPEAFGRVLIEAGASGVPVVATRVGGVSEVVEDGREGLLVPAQNPVALSEAILRLLKDPALAEKLSRNFRAKIEREYSLETMVEKTLQVYREVLESQRILVLKLGAVGDVVLITPSLRAIRRKFPKATITLLVGRDAFELVQHCPYLDELLTYDRVRKDKGLLGLWRLGSELRRRGFDLAIDLQNNKKSQLLSLLSLAPRRVGWARGPFKILINQRQPEPKEPMPPVQHQFRLLNALGIDGGDESLELWVQPKDDSTIERFLEGEWLSGQEPLVGLNLGGSPKWQTKRWPLEYYAALCDRLAQDNIRVVVTGTRSEEESLRHLLKAVQTRPIVAVGKTTLPQLAALLKRCKTYVTVDSAPLHVAASVGTPVIALFGPTDPLRHFPPQAKGTILNKQVPCHPCYRRQCPIGLICMTQITPEEVYQEIKRSVYGEKSEPATWEA